MCPPQFVSAREINTSRRLSSISPRWLVLESLSSVIHRTKEYLTYILNSSHGEYITVHSITFPWFSLILSPQPCLWCNSLLYLSFCFYILSPSLNAFLLSFILCFYKCTSLQLTVSNTNSLLSHLMFPRKGQVICTFMFLLICLIHSVRKVIAFASFFFLHILFYPLNYASKLTFSIFYQLYKLKKNL